MPSRSCRARMTCPSAPSAPRPSFATSCRPAWRRPRPWRTPTAHRSIGRRPWPSATTPMRPLEARCSATSPPAWSRSSTRSPAPCCARPPATACAGRRSSALSRAWRSARERRCRPRRWDDPSVLQAVFWASVALILYTHAGYPLLLWLLARLRRTRSSPIGMSADDLPPVSLIVAARDEERVIADKVANALALDYPRERLELIVASDGSADRTSELARAAGADAVLDLPRAGKVRTQDAGVESAGGEVLVFSDANTRLEAGALRRLGAAFADPQGGYARGAGGGTRGDGG